MSVAPKITKMDPKVATMNPNDTTMDLKVNKIEPKVTKITPRHPQNRRIAGQKTISALKQQFKNR